MNDYSPFISVILATYNESNYIRYAIESVINQTCGDWELIIVDDGSQDATKEICLEYCDLDDRIHYFYKENTGAMHSRIIGIKKASGKYLLGLDSDDYFDKDCFEIIKKELAQSDTDLLMWGHKFFGKSFYTYRLPRKSYINMEDCFYDIIIETNHPLWNKAIKREIIADEVLDSIPLQYMINLDYVMLMHLMIYVKSAKSIDECLYNVRVREQSVSNGVSKKKIIDICQTSEYVKCFLADNGIKVNQLNKAFSISYYKMIVGRLRDYMKKNGFDFDILDSIQEYELYRESYLYLKIKDVGIKDYCFMKLVYLIMSIREK